MGRRRKPRGSGVEVFRSRFGEKVIRKPLKEMVRLYEAYAFEQQSAKNRAEEHNCLQHAEHYIRMQNETDI